MAERKNNDLFGKPIEVINICLASMAEPIRDQGVPVIDIDWKPTADGVPRLRMTKSGIDIDEANEAGMQENKRSKTRSCRYGNCQRCYSRNA